MPLHIFEFKKQVKNWVVWSHFKTLQICEHKCCRSEMYECVNMWMCTCLYMCRHTCKMTLATSNRKPNLINEDRNHKNMNYVLKILGKKRKKQPLAFSATLRFNKDPSSFQLSIPPSWVQETFVLRIHLMVPWWPEWLQSSILYPKPRSRQWSVQQRVIPSCGHSFETGRKSATLPLDFLILNVSSDRTGSLVAKETTILRIWLF